MRQYKLSFDEPADAARPDEAEQILQGLNPAQQEAVRVTDGPVLIIAGPGSGKTRTLTHRIAYLIAAGKARPFEILALTFTNKAAREMKERIERLVGPEQARGMWMGTFHATFARLLRIEGERIGYTPDFSIYDPDDSQRILRELMDRYHVDGKQFNVRMMHALISSAKNRLVAPGEYARLAATPAQEKAALLYGPYQEALRKANAMDFDDLLLKPIELFRQHADVLEKYQHRWRYLHIDEYQDTNHAQYVLAKLLAARHKNLCVVGDDAQSIYAFRGADITNILSFQRDYPEAKTVRLEQNYRSTKTILRLADAIIRHNQDQLEKSLWTENSDGEPVTLLEAISERDEAQKVERTIRDLHVRQGYTFRDFAVLYRTNAQSRSLEEALRRGGLPYRVVGGVSFYQRREIKDALAYLRLVVNPNDEASLRRVINYPTRGIGGKTQEALFDYARREGLGIWQALERAEEAGLPARAVSAVEAFRFLIARHAAQATSRPADELARDLIRESGILDDLRRDDTPENLVRWENVNELLNAIAEFTAGAGEQGTLSAFLQEVSLLTDADSVDDDENRVTLMTLHASKGLEFPVVFITGLEEGLFPLAAAAQDRKDLEEERRLFYVGVTRAERHLYLSYARSRYRYGEQQPAVRSRFLDELDPDLIRTEAGTAFRPRAGRFQAGAGATDTYDRIDPHYYRKNLRGEKKPRTGGGGQRGGGERRIVYDEGEGGAFTPGMRVEHPLFGEGKVLSLEGAGAQAKAVVFFKEVGQKKLVLKFANLRRIG
ncbi:UvrD-helicase domain-containing protein [Rhodocaloribacter litoris]|uniref:ATP-dependent helicase n=1 Tax=Rhodocaloribacter litoris TaxID=2558931 RepID=UPI0014236264|nr:UvrD-helicase domain-containing protein [Rhodocaloribacter litoris]QXD16670.1 UvrD-helicase domain-containing protein [Rhodocaloribacter litoris]